MRVIVPGLFALALACMDVPSAQAMEQDDPADPGGWKEFCGSGRIQAATCLTAGLGVVLPVGAALATGAFWTWFCEASGHEFLYNENAYDNPWYCTGIPGFPRAEQLPS